MKPGRHVSDGINLRLFYTKSTTFRRGNREKSKINGGGEQGGGVGGQREGKKNKCRGNRNLPKPGSMRSQKERTVRTEGNGPRGKGRLSGVYTRTTTTGGAVFKS